MSMRRTRAMGLSPGGLQSLDMDAPTRKPRKGKASAASTSEVATSSTSVAISSKRASKRKNESEDGGERPVKRTRATKAAKASKPLPVAANTSQALISLPESESESTSAGVSTPLDEEPIVEPESLRSEPRVNAQQPTPPADTPSSDEANDRLPNSIKPASTLKEIPMPTISERDLEIKRRNERRVASLISISRKRHDAEEETALSDCDDDEWARRVPGVMSQYSAKKATPGYVEWINGSKGMLVVPETVVEERTTGEGGPHAISASLDWFEKNPSSLPPTATEMKSLLDDFERSKHPSSPRPDLGAGDSTTNTNPLTPTRAGTYGDFDSDSEGDRMEEEQAEEQAQEQQTQSLQGQPQAVRGWATALSASSIVSVFRSPVDWFSRRSGNRQNPSATEPRPTGSRTNTTRSEKPKVVQKSRAQPFSPTPAPRHSRRGRGDSHLPIHLRGLRYEHLPKEWQAVSQHMKKPEPEEEPVDFPALLEIARRTRMERDLKASIEKTESHARAQNAERDRLCNEAHVGSKRKRTKQPRVYSAKIGPSTFGMPYNIDDSSSSDENSEEDSEEAIHEPYTQDRPFLSPVKSCIKRQPRLYVPGRDGYQGSIEQDDDDHSELRPTKRVRREESAAAAERAKRVAFANQEVVFNDQMDDGPINRARPASKFISVPPSEAAIVRKGQTEYDEMNPIVAADPAQQEELDKSVAYWMKKRSEPAPTMEYYASGFGSTDSDKLYAEDGESEDHEAEAAARRSEERDFQEREQARRREEAARKKELQEKRRKDEAEKKMELEQESRREEERNALRQRIDKEREQEKRQQEKRQQEKLAQEKRRQEDPEQEQRQQEELDDEDREPLQESTDKQLNKLRESLQKYKPKVPSGLQKSQIMSPIHERQSLSLSIGDDSVMEAVYMLGDDDIEAEDFGEPQFEPEGTVSREASLAPALAVD